MKIFDHFTRHDWLFLWFTLLIFLFALTGGYAMRRLQPTELDQYRNDIRAALAELRDGSNQYQEYLQLAQINPNLADSNTWRNKAKEPLKQMHHAAWELRNLGMRNISGYETLGTDLIFLADKVDEGAGKYEQMWSTPGELNLGLMAQGAEAITEATGRMSAISEALGRMN